LKEESGNRQGNICEAFNFLLALYMWQQFFHLRLP